MHLVCVFEGKI